MYILLLPTLDPAVAESFRLNMAKLGLTRGLIAGQLALLVFMLIGTTAVTHLTARLIGGNGSVSALWTLQCFLMGTERPPGDRLFVDRRVEQSDFTCSGEKKWLKKSNPS